MNKLQRVQIAEGVLRLRELSNCARIHARDGSTDEWQLVYSTAAFWPCTDEMQPTDGWAFLILWHISDCFHFLAPYKKTLLFAYCVHSVQLQLSIALSATAAAPCLTSWTCGWCSQWCSREEGCCDNDLHQSIGSTEPKLPVIVHHVLQHYIYDCHN